MAPEIVKTYIDRVPKDSLVLDPMCGSGTVLRYAVEGGLDCVGYDMDPLAILMARGWTQRFHGERLMTDAELIVERALSYSDADLHTPWITEETDAFARYWFAPAQFIGLQRISQALRRSRMYTRPLLWLCLSRLVITKERGASLARDVSHSRPHRVKLDNDFDVAAGFLKAARMMTVRHEPDRIVGSAVVLNRDARCLRERGRYDLAITSPPYLNAIDYLRGHRLALIWLGYEIEALREIRARLVGAERKEVSPPIDVCRFIDETEESRIGSREIGWFRRFAADMLAVMGSLRRAVRPRGRVVLVVGNSMIKGAALDNVGIVVALAEGVGLRLESRSSREIPARHRYLPPPTVGSALAPRMRSEGVLEFIVDE